MKRENNKGTNLSTVKELSKLKKTELIESVIKYKQLAEEETLQHEAVRKDLLLIKEQLTATNIAIENIKTEKVRLTSKINQLTDENKILSTKLNNRECDVETYANDYSAAMDKLRLAKFWIVLLSIVSIFSFFSIVYISNNYLHQLCMYQIL